MIGGDNGHPAGGSTPLADGPTPADTGDKVAGLAAKYHSVTAERLAVMLKNGPDELVNDIRSMAGSLRRQNER
jgi:hypothetical protein